ncbi:hypothetical protein M501DRAFT_976660 [Patellaria atrata CBS 101060]|uniref:Neutral protease 2 n=1 Tax=Patellaria atrata CBS 101060 TaxID=1346257 RepID=A0A9P4VQI2_9PEZI|nr:hypothetical protein M501DRAFT_976660 [Patellaria atrata CBS 101060]
MRISASLSLAALVTLVSAASVNLNKRNSDVKVDIEAVGNTLIKAIVHNTGTSDLKLLKTGTFLDSAPVEHAKVFSATAPVAFEGIRMRVRTSGLNDEAFVPIAAGQTLEFEFDVAEVHDLSSGGNFDIFTEGAIPFAEADSNELSGSAVYFESNILSLSVDGEAARAKKVAFEKRTRIQSDCTGSRLSATQTALRNCQSLANAAANAAASGSASKFQEYFKTTSSSVRSTVAARFRAVASECSSTNSGATRQYCTDQLGACSSNTLAYTQPSTNLVVNCPIYFSALPALTRTCHAQDQATTTLHEYTHAPGVYSPGTDDYAYGYSASIALSSSRAVLNADTYALFANAIYVGC